MADLPASNNVTVRDESADLARQAAKRANRGDQAGAAVLWQRALDKQPLLDDARMSLADALVEGRQFAKAKIVLLDLLRINPRDLWALAALTKLHSHDNEDVLAERYLRIALAIQPENADIMSSLGSTCYLTGRYHEAEGFYRRAITFDPGWGSAHAGLAATLHQQDQIEEAIGAVRRLYTDVKPSALWETQACLAAGRQVFLMCEKDLMGQNQFAAAQSVEEIRQQTEALVGCHVLINNGAACRDTNGPQIICSRQEDHYELEWRDTWPEQFRFHLLGRTLLEIQARHLACRAGRSRMFTVPPEKEQELIRLAEEQAKALNAPGQDSERIAEIALQTIQSGLFHLCGSAPNMLLETRLAKMFPVLKPSQCLSLALAFTRQMEGRKCPVMLRLTPRLLSRRLNALHGLKGLFLDRLFEGATNFADDCRSNDGFDLSEKMWQHWQSRNSRMEPGDEFAIVDDFAEMLGLTGFYEWTADQFTSMAPRPLAPQDM
jgi:tetratricopeptide (TPR) repeat protein